MLVEDRLVVEHLQGLRGERDGVGLAVLLALRARKYALGDLVEAVDLAIDRLELSGLDIGLELAVRAHHGHVRSVRSGEARGQDLVVLGVLKRLELYGNARVLGLEDVEDAVVRLDVLGAPRPYGQRDIVGDIVLVGVVWGFGRCLAGVRGVCIGVAALTRRALRISAVPASSAPALMKRCLMMCLPSVGDVVVGGLGARRRERVSYGALVLIEQTAGRVGVDRGARRDDCGLQLAVRGGEELTCRFLIDLGGVLQDAHRALAQLLVGVATTETMRFDQVRPTAIIRAVENPFRTSFSVVAAFNRVEPVRTSAPVSRTMSRSAKGESEAHGLDETSAVHAPTARAVVSAPRT